MSELHRLPETAKGNLEEGFRDVKYIRKFIVDDLRRAAKKSRGDRAKLYSEAADEIAELRVFIDKQAQLIARFIAEIARDA